MARPLKLIVTQVTNNLEEEEESMDLKQRIGLKGLLANMNKGSTSKEAPLGPASQYEQRVNLQGGPFRPKFSTNLPPPPHPQLLIDLGLKANPNLKKKRTVEDLEEGEVRP